MTSLLTSADDLLRGRLDPDALLGASAGRAFLRLLLLISTFGLFYGAIMGTFGGIHGDRWLQLIYSGVKVPMLLMVTFLLSLPSFFVLNTILGVRSDFRYVMQSLIATQAGLTVVLAALAPFTAFWYASSSNYSAALNFNTAMFAVAAFAAQGMLRRSYRPLIAANPRHRLLFRTWLVIYAFVGIQMAWVLRPFVGSPSNPVSFFRADAWGNAYIEMINRVAHSLGL